MYKFEFTLQELQLFHKVHVGQDISQSNKLLVERGWSDGWD